MAFAIAVAVLYFSVIACGNLADGMRSLFSGLHAHNSLTVASTMSCCPIKLKASTSEQNVLKKIGG